MEWQEFGRSWNSIHFKLKRLRGCQRLLKEMLWVFVVVVDFVLLCFVFDFHLEVVHPPKS